MDEVTSFRGYYLDKKFPLALPIQIPIFFLQEPNAEDIQDQCSRREGG
jgi:hypothetical protein